MWVVEQKFKKAVQTDSHACNRTKCTNAICIVCTKYKIAHDTTYGEYSNIANGIDST